MKHIFMCLLIAISLISCSQLAAQPPYELHGKVYDPPEAAPPLALTDQYGQAFSFEAYKGKIILLFFGYTHCPDICPGALGEMLQVQRKLGELGQRMQAVFVTVDPERDSQQQLGQYVSAFDPSFLGLRGSQEELAPILRDYRVKVQRTELPNSALGYAIDHSAYLFVIDTQGRLRQRLIQGTDGADAIVSDLRYLLERE